MHAIRLFVPAFAGVLLQLNLIAAVTIPETFNANPLNSGWRTHGDASFFTWNASNQNLEVTWDSRQTNTYFYRPLGTVLSRYDDFALSFDLLLLDAQIGVNPGKQFTFQIALGLINCNSATNDNFLRGTGTDSPNLVTFDYFPDSGFGASVAPGVVSRSNEFAFGFLVYEITNEPVHVDMRYSAAAQTLTTVVTTNGVASSPVENVLGSTFTDFRLDTLSINSYSDAGQHPDFAGSILARGIIDNLVLTLPDPPVQMFTGTFSNGVWTATFQSQTNWLYALDRTANFQSWAKVATAAGTGQSLTLQDNSPSPANAFYRIRAERP